MPKNLIDECKLNAEETCQHITEGGTALWIIPSGTHYFFGHTVSGTGFTGSAGTNQPSADVKQQADDLAKDLLRILEKHDVTISIHPDELKDLMVELSIYMVNRDHRVLEHGIKLGKEGKQ